MYGFLAAAIGLLTRVRRYFKRLRYLDRCANCDHREDPSKKFDIANRCPECGMTCEAGDRRNRHRLTLSAFACTALLALAIGAGVLGYRKQPIATIMPNWVVVRLASPLAIENGKSSAQWSLASSFREELDRRCTNGLIDSKGIARFAQRTLDALDAAGSLVWYRREWPRNVPFRVHLVENSQLIPMAGFTIRVRSQERELLYERVIANPAPMSCDERTILIPDIETRNTKTELFIELVDTTGVARAQRSLKVEVSLVDSWRDVLTLTNGEFRDFVRVRSVTEYPIGDGQMNTSFQMEKMGHFLVGGHVEIVQNVNTLASAEFAIGDENEICVRLKYPAKLRSEERFLRIHPDPEMALRARSRSNTCMLGNSVDIPLQR